MKRYIIITTFILLTIQSCTQKNESILFSSNRNGNSDIFIMDASGENQKALTDTKFEEWGPTWINENEISFLRQEADSIFRVSLNMATNKETPLKHPLNCVLDDKNVLYSTSNAYNLYSCENDIFFTDQENNSFINITENLNGKARYPSWSNDAKRILFTSNHLGTNDVFSYTLSTEKILQLTDSEANNERGELSPNGNFLAFSSDYFEKGNQEILLKNLETGKLTNISKSPGMELIARFSENGNKLYFGSNKDGNWEIYLYNLETGNQTRLTTNKAFDGDPRIFKK